MISLLTSLKPFRGDVARIQDAALGNWRRLDPAIEIILYGDGEGVADCALRFGAVHVPDVRANPQGVPDFAAIAEHAAGNARFDTQVYLNGDILLPPDFVRQIGRVALDRYLIVGQRINLTEAAVFDPRARDWREELLRLAAHGHVWFQPPWGIDYFVFPRGLWQGLPPLIVGRSFYDSALLAFCLRNGIPIVDATWSIYAVHQWHDYSHLAGANDAQAKKDAAANRRLHDIEHSCPDVEDAAWRLTGDRLVSCGDSPNPLRRLEVFLRYRKGWKGISYLCRGIARAAWIAGCLRPREVSVAAVVGGGSEPTAISATRGNSTGHAA
jgi:hypothetical protein